MDQVLKDMMLDIADMDHQAGLEGMQGAVGEEEIGEIMGKVYKVKPFGLSAANMRSLNPSGLFNLFIFTFAFDLTYYRYKDTDKRFSHSCHTCYS